MDYYIKHNGSSLSRIFILLNKLDEQLWCENQMTRDLSYNKDLHSHNDNVCRRFLPGKDANLEILSILAADLQRLLSERYVT